MIKSRSWGGVGLWGLVVLLFGYAIVMSIKNTYRYTQVSKELAAAKHDLSLKKQRLNHLQTRLDMVSSNTSIEVAIKSRLGYIHKGEHVFRLSQRK